MNKKSQFKFYRLIQHIDHNSRSGNKEGYCKCYPNNSDEHEDVKWAIFKKLKKQGYSVYSECKFVGDAGRADLIAFSKKGDGYIIEVGVSESLESYNKKLNKYPLEFEMVFVDGKNFDIHKWDL